MKRIFLIGILWLSALAVTYAQQDTKAKKLLDQTTEIYQNAGGVSIHFTGSQNGKLLLDGNRFYLECGGVKSWFDGRTQWSYVSQNEEVTVSSYRPSIHTPGFPCINKALTIGMPGRRP